MDVVCVTVDCAEPAAVAAFWSAICGPEEGGIYLECIRVPEPKTVKNRVHLGCAAGSLAELDAELERLVALGASIAWEETFPPEVAAAYRNVVMRDVEGNEFCLSGGSLG
jgi:Glyoxalase-like domain